MMHARGRAEGAFRIPEAGRPGTQAPLLIMPIDRGPRCWFCNYGCMTPDRISPIVERSSDTAEVEC